MTAGSFRSLALVLLLTAATSAAAQQPIYIPPPPQPPAPVALAVPDPLGALQPAGPDLYRSPDGSDRFLHSALYPAPPPVVIPGGYLPYWPYYLPGPAPDRRRLPPPQPMIARGGLTLETHPDVAHVYVDGFYVGLAQDFGIRGRRLELSEGAHRVELRAPDYETLSFSVLIAPNDLVRYRGDMRALVPPSPPPAQQPSPKKSYYVVPYCYAGDKPPARALPSRCDLKKLQTLK